MSDYQIHTASGFADVVAQTLVEAEPKSVTYYAATSLLEFLRKQDISTIDGPNLKFWVASMLMEGRKVASVKRYAAKLHAIYMDWAGAEAADPFAEVQSVFESKYQAEGEDVAHNLDLLKRLFSRNESSADWKVVGIFFYLLYSADATLLDAVRATFDNAPRYCAQVDDIVKSCSSSFGRQYLFALNQSKARSGQILKTLGQNLASTMKMVGMKIAPTQEREEITAMWIVAAMKCGVDLRDIRAIVPSVPYRFRALSLIEKQPIAENRKRQIICRVADSLNENTPRWFVMKLRRGVTLADIKDKINCELPGRLATMELYYPTRTKAKKVGKKVVKEEIPYVPDMLFFRTQYNKVRSLFAKIGDLAWCLKVSPQPDSAYSVISHAEMTNFQHCVGQFTDDIKVEFSETAPALSKGRAVRITGGMMKGYEGIIEDLDEANGIRKFSLRVSSSSALNWAAEVEEYYIEPI